MYKLDYVIDVEEMILFFEDGNDVKVELYQDGTCEVFPINSCGYEERIYTLYYEAYAYFECGNFKSYMNFLATCENVIHKDGFEITISYK